MSNLSRILAQHVAEVGFDALPAQVVGATKRSLLDAIGVTLAASGLGEGTRAFVDLAREAGGSRQSTIIGFGDKVPVTMAAFANGAMAHALDFEDAYDGAPVHPNAATVPAALAIAESLPGVTGKELILAIATGCDLVCRLGLSLTENLDDNGWYPPPILGAFGATAAAAKLLKLDPGQILDAFSLTLCQATCSAELKYSPHSTIRAVRDAFATQVATQAALLAQKGVKGFDRPFEGKAGFFVLYAHGNYDPTILLDELGRRFAGEHISFKPWPTCRGTHALIEGALDIASTHALQASNVAQVRMTGSPTQRMLDQPSDQKRRPSTAIDAKFSLPFTVATALLHRTVNLCHFFPSALKDAAVLELAQRMSFEVDPKFGMTAGSVEIRTHDGSVQSRRIDQPYGHPSNPMSDEDLIRKFRDCAGHSARPLRPTHLDKLIGNILGLETHADVRAALFDHALSG